MSKSQFLSGFWVEVQSMTRWENEIQCGFFFSFLFYFFFLKKILLFKHLTDENAQEVMQKEKAGLKC